VNETQRPSGVWAYALPAWSGGTTTKSTRAGPEIALFTHTFYHTESNVYRSPADNVNSECRAPDKYYETSKEALLGDCMANDRAPGAPNRCIVSRPNGQACANEGQYECENGHNVCFFHSIRTIGAQSSNNRKCLACMEAGKTSFVHRIERLGA